MHFSSRLCCDYQLGSLFSILHEKGSENWVIAGMSFAKKEHEFLRDIDLGPKNEGCYVAGKWQAHGPLVSTVNPADNQVFFFTFLFRSFVCLKLIFLMNFSCL